MARSTLKLLSLTLLVAAVARADEAAKPPSTEETLVTDLATAKWITPKVPGMPPGPRVSPVAADPHTGGSVGYAKIPAGYKFPMHWHTHGEYTAVVSGKGTLTIDGKAHEIGPGTYFVIPGKVHHELVCGADADCVLLTRRGGKTDYHFVTAEK